MFHFPLQAWERQTHIRCHVEWVVAVYRPMLIASNTKIHIKRCCRNHPKPQALRHIGASTEEFCANKSLANREQGEGSGRQGTTTRLWNLRKASMKKQHDDDPDEGLRRLVNQREGIL